jgi:hypothetical protein
MEVSSVTLRQVFFYVLLFALLLFLRTTSLAAR